MKRLEDYLSDATRGLFGRRKKAVQLELRGAIEDKLHRYQTSGMSEKQALERTLQDLGSARALRGGFFRLHSAPLLGQLGALVLASSAAVLALWPSSVAQVAATLERFPRSTCTLNDFEKMGVGAPDDVRAYFKKVAQNVPQEVYQEVCREGQVRGPGGSLRFDAGELARAFEKKGVKLVTNDSGMVGLKFPEPGATSFWIGNCGTAGSDCETLPSRDLIGIFARSGLPVRLEGLVNPQLWVGSYQVQLGTKQLPVLTSSLFEDQLFMKRADNDWNSRLATPLRPFPLRRSGLEKQALEGQFQSLQRRVDAPDGTKFFVISRAFQGYVYDSILTEAKNGMVSLYVTHKDATRVRWVDSWAALTAPSDDNRALVLTLLNQDHLEFLDWDILPPSSIKRQ